MSEAIGPSTAWTKSYVLSHCNHCVVAPLYLKIEDFDELSNVNSSMLSFMGIKLPRSNSIFSASCPYSSFNRRGEIAGAIPLKVLFLKHFSIFLQGIDSHFLCFLLKVRDFHRKLTHYFWKTCKKYEKPVVYLVVFIWKFRFEAILYFSWKV